MFGQVVIGPPGSGKTTYCKAMAAFLRGLKRRVVLVNLDPANDVTPYTANVDLTELIRVQEVMEHMNLGPNGALIYCMEFLEKNVDWLLDRLAQAAKSDDHKPGSSTTSNKGTYFVFDFPGQVELYTHNDAVKNVLTRLTKEKYRLVAVQLMDSTYCTDPGRYMSMVLTALHAMVQLECPFISVLSKIDLLKASEAELPFGLDFFENVLDLRYLLECLPEDPFLKRYRRLSEAICGLIEDYSLVSFLTLDVQDSKSMLSVLSAADKANGFCFGSDEERSIRNMMSCAFSDGDPSEETEESILKRLAESGKM